MPEVITDNLDLWTSALLTKSTAGRGSNGKLEAYGINKLRELILELAVRGKLVLQGPNDEPASVLLERVATEKFRLFKEGEIGKAKVSHNIESSELPYEIPANWSWARLGDLCYLENGDRSKNYPNKSLLVEEGIPFINAGHLEDSRINMTEMNYISEVRFNLLRSGKVREGDILYCLRGSLGKSAIVHGIGRGAIASSLVIVRAFAPILNRYVLNYFQSPLALETMHRYDNGTAQPNLSATDLAKFVVPVPPATEQHRVVAKVDELMALCDRLEHQQTHSIAAHQTLVETLLGTLTRVGSQQEFSEAWARIANHFDMLFTTEHSIDQLKQTILQLAVMGKLVPQDPNDEPAEALLIRVNAAKEQLIVERKIRQADEAELSEPNELFEVPPGWLWVYVRDVAIVQGGKRLPNGAVLLETRTPHIYIRVTDMKNGTVSETGLMYISPEVQRHISRYTINKEDLYITIAGTIGDVGVIPDALDGQNLTENAAKIVFRILDKRFFQLALSSDFVQAQFLEKTKQMAQPKLALKRIAGAKFCLPPLSEQHRIVAKVDELMALCDALKARIRDAQTTQIHLADAIVEQAVA